MGLHLEGSFLMICGSGLKLVDSGNPELSNGDTALRVRQLLEIFRKEY
jgi:hypothetical protein